MATDPENEAVNGVEVDAEDGEVSLAEIAATKVHIEGLVDMNTQDVENFARDHFPSDSFRRVEWVNDYSANLIYDTPQAATAALRTLAVSPVEDPLELRLAKTSITHPQVELSIRQAVVTDQKVKNAAAQSAFYLNHPEYDPENRPSRGRGGRGRGPRRDGGYGRHRRSLNELSPGADKPFDVNLYDDDPISISARRVPDGAAGKVSTSLEEDLFADRASKRRRTSDEDLIKNRSDGRLKDRSRSRSPAREGDGRFGFSDDQPYRQTARRRSPPPPRRRLSNVNRLALEKKKAELFPGKKSSAALEINGRDRSSIDLFPQKSFPGKHPHVDPNSIDLCDDMLCDDMATSASAVKIFEIIPRTAQNTYNSQPGRRTDPPRSLTERIGSSKPRDLFAKNDISLSAGRLNAESSAGFSIKGAGGAKNEPVASFGFLGASKERKVDLFANKIAVGGGGDLFPEKVRSRRKGASEFI